MKKMKFAFLIALAGLFLITSCESEDNLFTGELKKGKAKIAKEDFNYSEEFEKIVYTPGEELSVPLMAGKYEEVGVVKVIQVAESLKITFEITDPASWGISETHLSVTNSLDDVPGYPGNPKIGLFNCNEGYETEEPYVFMVPIPDPLPDDLVYIMAHAVVEDFSKILDYGEPDIEAFNLSLPENVVEFVSSTLPDDPRLFYSKTTISEGGFLDGEYGSWCIDSDYGIIGGPFTARVYSSYSDDLPEGLIDPEKVDNLDLVNWILNQNFVTSTSDYTAGDVQRAIWTLIDEVIVDPYLGDYDDTRVQNILNQAYENGVGFIPGCGENIVLILQPIDPDTGIFSNKQPTIITYPLPCEPIYGDETAWALGYAFTGASWAMYFTYDID